jgi:Fe-S-cluster containining protein
MTSPSPQQRQARSEAFGYVCHRCSRCCYDKIIQVNPYEIARLARNRGQTTSEFRDAWTDDGLGTVLRRREDGACVFLGSEGCTAHPDRPLVCRIYPLGRHVAADGTERWSHSTPHPLTEGVYSKDGSVADYLAQQDAGDFIRAADDYTQWLRRAGEALEAAGVGPEAAVDGAKADLLDMDGAITAHCAATGEAEPAGIEARKALHLTILYNSLVAFAGGAG